jgi:threonine/homoserine/homoserine lactone efflux protein
MSPFFPLASRSPARASWVVWSWTRSTPFPMTARVVQALRVDPDVHALAVCAIALAFGFFGSMPLLGPISVVVVSRVANREFDDARRIGVGAALAEGIYAAIAFWGFAEFLSRHPIVVPLSHGATALLLVGLGIRFMLFREDDQRHTGTRRTGSTLLGFSVSALNPTLIVTWSAAVAFLYSKGLGGISAAYAIPFGACAGAGVAAWFVLLVNVLRKYEARLARKALATIVRGLGVVLLGLGVWSGVQLAGWLRLR